MADLLELAARCEAAEEPDRETDLAIEQALNPGVIFGATAPLLAYTASLDAAMLLVPGGHVFRLIGDNPGKCKAGVDLPGCVRLNVTAATPALALCAAALRARSVNTPQDQEAGL